MEESGVSVVAPVEPKLGIEDSVTVPVDSLLTISRETGSGTEGLYDSGVREITRSGFAYG